MIRLSTFLVVSFCTISLANANVVYSLAQDKGSVYIGYGTDTTIISYDAATNQFTGLFEGSDFKHFVNSSDVDLAPDFSGTFTLNATIDQAGHLFGGTVNWVGGGSGIASGTTLLEGNLTDFLYLHGGDPSFPGLPASQLSSTFNFIIDVTYANTALNFSDQLELQLYFAPPSYDKPFESSFTKDTSYTGQDLLSINSTQVPEPPSVALLALGLASLLFVRRSKESPTSSAS